MKQNWTVYIWKLDRRTKAGERLFSTTVWKDRDQVTVHSEVRQLQLSGQYAEDKFRIEFHPTTRTVKSLMTGQDVEIDWNAPHCCDPSREAFWSM